MARAKETVMEINCNPHAGYPSMERYFEKRADHGISFVDVWVSKTEMEKAKAENVLWYAEIKDEISDFPVNGRIYASSLCAIVSYLIKDSKDE